MIIHLGQLARWLNERLENCRRIGGRAAPQDAVAGGAHRLEKTTHALLAGCDCRRGLGMRDHALPNTKFATKRIGPITRKLGEPILTEPQATDSASAARQKMPVASRLRRRNQQDHGVASRMSTS